MDEYYIPGFTTNLMTGLQRLPTAQPVQTAAYDTPTVSNFVGGIPGTMSSDFSGVLNKVLAQAEQQGLTQPASAPTGALSTAAQPAQPTASPQYKWGVLGGPADQPQYTVNFRSNKRGDMPLTVSADTPIFLYDNKTKQVIASGVGFEGADAVAEAVSRMSAQGKNNWWDIYTGPAGSTDPSQFKVAISDQKNTNFGQRFLGNLGTILPIAVSFIPGFGQLSLGAKIAAGAAAGAGGAALKGQDILKGALLGGATSGVMNAPVLGGGKTLSGVVGGALESVPGIGDALKEVSKIASNSPGVYDPALGGYVVSGATSATPALISGGLSSLASSQLNNALNLAQKYPGTTNYADQVYDKTLQDDFDATFGPTVYGKRLTDLASTATGLTGGIAGTVPGAGTYYKDENLVEVAGDKTKPPANDVASGAAQTLVNEFKAPENVDPNEIVVSNKYRPKSLDDIATGAISALAPSLFQPGPQTPTTTDTKKKLGVEDYLRLAGLALGALGATSKKTPSNLSGLSGMRGSLSPVFSASLPSATLPAATARPATALPRSEQDWYRYAYGPEQSFFSNVPQGAPNTSTAYTGYAEGGAAGTGHRGSFAVGGPGDGRDDKIPALLSDGEYVMDAETVAMLGNGSSKAGADALDKFRVAVRKHKGRDLAKGKFSAKAKKPEQYLKGRK